MKHTLELTISATEYGENYQFIINPQIKFFSPGQVSQKENLAFRQMKIGPLFS